MSLHSFVRSFCMFCYAFRVCVFVCAPLRDLWERKQTYRSEYECFSVFCVLCAKKCEPGFLDGKACYCDPHPCAWFRAAILIQVSVRSKEHRGNVDVIPPIEHAAQTRARAWLATVCWDFINYPRIELCLRCADKQTDKLCLSLCRSVAVVRSVQVY